MLNPRRWGIPSTTPVSPPTMPFDVGTELFVAHHIVLEKKAMDAVKVGGTPGIAQGMVSSKSVGPVSGSYDTASIKVEDAGHWNQTVYGLRFVRLSRFRGSGPIQVGIGYNPLYPNSGQAWAGPPLWPGWYQ